MEPIEVFQILGIEQTKDERALKNAYRDKLTVTNPEDDPDGLGGGLPLCRNAGCRRERGGGTDAGGRYSGRTVGTWCSEGL